MTGSRLLVLSVILLMGIPQLDAACTAFSFSEYQKCTRSFYVDVDSSIDSGSKTVLSTFCSTGSVKHKTCVSNVAAECRNGDGIFRRLWDNTINVNIVRDTLNVICEENNTATIFANEECIKRNQPSVASCLTREAQAYQTRIQRLANQGSSRGTDWYEEQAYKAACEYVDIIGNCEKPYETDCGKDVGKIFEGMREAATPPVCSAVTSSINILTLAFLSLLACFKGEF